MAHVGKELALRHIGHLCRLECFLQFIGPLLNDLLEIPVLIMNSPLEDRMFNRMGGIE